MTLPLARPASEPAALDHLFRREAGRIVSGLTRLFGVRHLPLAQDVVQEAFCRALEVWKFSGVPDNPSAWLAATARNRAIDVLRREQWLQSKAPDLAALYPADRDIGPVVEACLSADIADDQLRMMFSCCHPSLSARAQVSLILHVLCGFNAREVAAAFLETPAAAAKRLQRATRTLAGTDALFSLASIDELRTRLDAVLRALYLLFNEGYHGSHPERPIREELCEEAVRLAALVTEHAATSTPAAFALLALMCLGAARLPGRVDEAGALRELTLQDRSTWNRPLLAKGLDYLDRAATGPEIGVYHLEAAISAEHAMAPSVAETNWPRIVDWYDQLAAIVPGPVVLLNRAIAVGAAHGPARGLDALRSLPGRQRLRRYPFYAAAQAEFLLRLGRLDEARDEFGRAVAAARTAAERRFLEARVATCDRST